MSVDEFNLVTLDDDHETTFWTPRERSITLERLFHCWLVLFWNVPEDLVLALEGSKDDLLSFLVSILGFFGF